MTFVQVCQVAKSMGLLDPESMHRKIDLVHMIQRQEGNFDCFGTASVGECNQRSCRWRGDCFVAAALE